MFWKAVNKSTQVNIFFYADDIESAHEMLKQTLKDEKDDLSEYELIELGE